jgi:hypothetical protein
MIKSKSLQKPVKIYLQLKKLKYNFNKFYNMKIRRNLMIKIFNINN